MKYGSFSLLIWKGPLLVHRLHVFSAVLVAVLVTLSTPAVGAEPVATTYTVVNTHLVGPTIGSVIPSGQATYQASGTTKRLVVNAWDVNLAGVTLDVKVGSTKVGALKVSANRNGSMYLSSVTGATIPSITKTTVITLVNPSTASVVLSGPPTKPRFMSIYAKMTGAAIAGRSPTGRSSYQELNYGYATRLRVSANNVNLVGKTLDIYLGGTKLGSATVSPLRALVFVSRSTAVTSTSVIKIKKSDGTVILVSGAWSAPVTR